MNRECVTHHYACDCREQKFVELEKENEHLRRSLEVTRQIKCAQIVEAEKLDILRGCLEDILKLTDIHEAHLFAKQALHDTKGGDQ